MGRDNDFLVGLLNGLYQGGLGNPRVNQAREEHESALQKNQMEMDKLAQDSGMTRDTPDPKTFVQKFLSGMFPGGSGGLKTAYKQDPDAQSGYISSTGELSNSQTDGSIPLSPGDYKKAMMQRANQPIYNIYTQDASGKFTDKTQLPRGERPGPILKPQTGTTGGRGSTQQSQLVDSHDSTPLLFDRDNKRYIRSTDNNPVIGSAIPMKGNAEAVTQTSRGLELIPKIDSLFDALDKKGEMGARASVTPLIGPLIYPEITQLKNELKQVGFTFGGKNFTGNEEKIISGAMIPGPLDSKESRDAKRKAIKGYVSGQIDLLSAANLLGASGKTVKDLLSKATGNDPHGTIKTINSQAEYDALPSGSDYIDSNGVPARKK